jgi:hypothetical protein
MMRLKPIILAAALLTAAPAHTLFAQASKTTGSGKATAATTDYNKLYASGVEDYNAQRNLQAIGKFRKVLQKNPKHVQTLRYLSLSKKQLSEAAAVPVMKRRLHALVLEEATFEEATLAEVMEFVTMTAKKLSNGEVKPGLVIRGGDAVRDRSLTFKIGAVPLDTLIETVASLTNTTVKYTDYAITFTSLPSAADIAERAARQLEQAEAKQRAREAAENGGDPFRNR